MTTTQLWRYRRWGRPLKQPPHFHPHHFPSPPFPTTSSLHPPLPLPPSPTTSPFSPNSLASPASSAGPVYSVAWSSSSAEFCVVYGLMPAKAKLFNQKAEPIFDFGAGPRNSCAFNPHVSPPLLSAVVAGCCRRLLLSEAVVAGCCRRLLLSVTVVIFFCRRFFTLDIG